MIRLLAFVTAFSLLVSQVTAQNRPDSVVTIWPNSPPEWITPDQPEQDTTGPDGRLVAGERVTRLGFVSKPELHVYRAVGSPGDTAVLICPGGGYSRLAWDLEGTEIAEWLQGVGVTAIVVKYRVPTGGNEKKWLAPVQDIQRSISLVRGGAIDGVAPKRVGVLGFSAGGNAAARTAIATDRFYEAIDSFDQVSCGADFAVLVYPAWLVQQDDESQLIEEFTITDKTPPMFFAHAFDDRISCMSSVTLFSELKRHGITSALHVFSSGGHGFGSRPAGQPTDAWPALCETWMKQQGWLE